MEYKGAQRIIESWWKCSSWSWWFLWCINIKADQIIDFKYVYFIVLQLYFSKVRGYRKIDDRLIREWEKERQRLRLKLILWRIVNIKWDVVFSSRVFFFFWSDNDANICTKRYNKQIQISFLGKWRKKITALKSKEVEFTFICKTDSFMLERGTWAWSLCWVEFWQICVGEPSMSRGISG